MGGHAMTGKQTEDEAFVLEHRRELALAYMRRADESATVLRTVLLTVCSAAIGFIFYQRAATLTPHLPSLFIFGVAAGTILWSWDLQKDKSIERFKALRSKQLDAFFDQDSRSNQRLDRIAALLVLSGAVAETLTTLFVK
jgi:hypothetical protein